MAERQVGNVVDVAIVGGGMAGSVLAAGLGRAGFSVVLIDRAEPDPAPAQGRELRAVALSLASEQILRQLGLWPIVAQRPMGEYRRMHVWDAAGYGSITFNASEVGSDKLGSIVENNQIQRAAWQALPLLGNVKVLCPASVAGLTVDDSVATLRLADDSTIAARLVVSAEGGNAALREQLGIGSYERSYNQHGIVATVQTALPHDQTAWQRFLPTGPLAFLPLAEPNKCSIVWSTSDSERLLALSDEQFAAELTQALGGRLGDCRLLGDRASFPLQAKLAETAIAKRFALVGDAAHVIHPLAGQGGNLALLDVASLIDVLSVARQRQRDIGSATVLRRYDRWRKTENAAMLLALDGLKHLYGSQNPLVGRIRSIGLNLVDAARPLRRRLARHAAGIEGDLPALAKRD